MQKIVSFLLDLLFPATCLVCARVGDYLCQDCRACFNILRFQPPIKPGSLDGLYCALNYNDFLVKKLIHQFKYPPYVKALSKPLTSLIITHFALLDKSPAFVLRTSAGEPDFFEPAPSLPAPSLRARRGRAGAEFILVPVPLHKSKLRERGFNQSEELARELKRVLAIPLVSDCLLKIKKTLPQVQLKEAQRQGNVKGVFFCSQPGLVQGKKVLLVDDIYTTGATMEEAARVLKAAAAYQVWGVAAARG